MCESTYTRLGILVQRLGSFTSIMSAHPATRLSGRAHTCKGTLKTYLLLSLFLLICLGSSCEGFFVDPTVTAIAVTPPTPSIVQNKTQQMTATASYDDGSVKDITSKAIWSTSDPNKVTVSSAGLVTGSVRVPRPLPPVPRT